MSPREPERRGGSVAFRVPDFKAVHAELARREIICDSRPDVGLRFGPHFFTTDDEIRYAVEQVVDMLDTGAHLERATSRSRVLDQQASAITTTPLITKTAPAVSTGPTCASRSSTPERCAQ